MAFRVTRMSLQQQQQQVNENNENAHGGFGKGRVSGKEFAGAVVKRSALGDIGNKVTNPTKAEGLQARDAGIKKITKKVSAQVGRVKVMVGNKTTKPTLAKPILPVSEVKSLCDKVVDTLEFTAEDDDIDMKEDFQATLLSAELAPFQLPHENIDAEDEGNPLFVSEYVLEIYDYLKQTEKEHMVDVNYMQRQTDINGRMRAILIDWLVEVHLKFKLLPEALYLTVYILDAYLTQVIVSRHRLQLVGVTAMLIACKYEEIYAPEVSDFVYITDNTYSRWEILEMESHMLKMLGFRLGAPLPIHFLRRDSKAARACSLTHTVAKFLCELSLIEYDMLSHHPSILAAAALCTSQCILQGFTEAAQGWDSNLEHWSGYSLTQIEKPVSDLFRLLAKQQDYKLTAVRVKYASEQYRSITELPQIKSLLTKQQ